MFNVTRDEDGSWALVAGYLDEVYEAGTVVATGYASRSEAEAAAARLARENQALDEES